MTVGPSSVAEIRTMCSENNVTITSLQSHNASSYSPSATADQARPTATSPTSSATTTAESPTSAASSSPSPPPQVANTNDDHDVTPTTAETRGSAAAADETALTSVHVEKSPTSVTSLSPGSAHDGGELGGDGGGGGDDVLHRVSSVTSGRMSESLKVVTFEDPDVNGFEQLLKLPANSANVLHVEDCSKLVYQLSKELAILHALSGGIGCDSDSSRLREELRLSRHRACTLTEQNATALIPLLRSKNNLKKDEASEVEKLYRIYSGCLEYLLFLLVKIRSLVNIFPPNIDPCYLIRTGISDPVSFAVHKSAHYVQKEGAGPAGEGTSAKRTANQSTDDLPNLVGDIKSMKQLLYVVTSACDVQPWDVADENPQKQRKSSGQSSNRRESRGISFNDGTSRRLRVMVILAVLITLLVIVAVAVTITLLTMS